MTKERALQILKAYQYWRLGYSEIFVFDPKDVTEALDIAIKSLEG